MANLIELIARWKDEGATAGLQKMTVATNVLTNAIGVGAGVGMIGSLAVLSRGLGNMIRQPLELADSMAKLTDQMRAGSEITKEAYTQYRRMVLLVGSEGVQKFEALAAAQRQASSSFQDFATRLAVNAAPMKTALLEIAETMLFLARATSGVSFQTLNAELARESNLRAVAGRPQMLSAHGAGPQFIGPTATPEQLRYAAELEKERLAKEKLIDVTRRFNEMVLFLASQPLEIPGARAPLPPGDVATQIFGRGGVDAELERIKEQKKQIDEAGERLEELRNIGLNAAESIASGLANMLGSFVSGIQTLGQAARAFWQALVRDILAEITKLVVLGLVKLGLSFVTGGAAAAIPLPGPVPGAMRAARGRSEGGNTYIFQGLNTRDMFMEVGLRSGSLARANDLVLMRSEAG